MALLAFAVENSVTNFVVLTGVSVGVFNNIKPFNDV